jgi:hypothetical protein
MTLTTIENENSIEGACSAAPGDMRPLREDEIATVSGGTQVIKWYNVGGGLALGFDEATGLWAGWGTYR